MQWMRYPGRLAHLTADPEPIIEQGQRVGTTWRTICGRYVRLWWDERPWQGQWLDPLELRAERPRGWCLRCGFWAALTGLALSHRSYSQFVEETYRT